MPRLLAPSEKNLIRWMLEHGHSEACAFLLQLEQAVVTDWRCPCGCPSINLSVEGAPEPVGGLNVLADFLFGDEPDMSGIFVYEKQGFLAGLEVYGLSGDVPKILPSQETLRPFKANILPP